PRIDRPDPPAPACAGGSGRSTANRRQRPGSRQIAFEDRVELRVVPAAVAPESLAGPALVAVAAVLVDAAHGGVDRVAVDAVQAELVEREPSPGPHRVGGVAAPPAFTLAEEEPAAARSELPVVQMKADEADVASRLVQDRPPEVLIASALH